jgi:hypothetical protein
MRHPVSIMLCLGGAVFLSACQDNSDAQVQRALKDVNVIDESNLNDVMLSVADPNEAVEYFTRTLEQNPNRIDVMRGLARSLIRAQKTTESAQVWRQVVAHPEATPEDRVMLADPVEPVGRGEGRAEPDPADARKLRPLPSRSDDRGFGQELEESRQLLRNRSRADHHPGGCPEQLGFLEADAG